jgi:dTDP-4-amino-4,6-dideoxygalactose transaminase
MAVVAALRSDWLTTGPAVERFEASVASYVGASYAVSFSSGTAALHGAMSALDVSAGDIVVAPPLTFAATMNAALFCGARPVFADISPDTLCLDPALAEEACGEAGGAVKAVIPVSYGGYPVDASAFRGLAHRCGAAFVEDASHALGAKREFRVGQEADMTVFSFHPVKHVTTFEGGMVVTNSEEFSRRLRLFRSHGIVKSPEEFVRPYEGQWDNDMISLGCNYRLSDVASALGESQMKRLDYFLARRRELAGLYRELLSGVLGVRLPPDHPGHAYHLFPIWVSPGVRKDVFNFLRGVGVGVQVHYVPVHLHTYYKERFGFRDGMFPNAEAFSSGEISIPLYPDMSDRDAVFVVEKLKSALARS